MNALRASSNAWRQVRQHGSSPPYDHVGIARCLAAARQCHLAAAAIPRLDSVLLQRRAAEVYTADVCSSTVHSVCTVRSAFSALQFCCTALTKQTEKNRKISTGRRFCCTTDGQDGSIFRSMCFFARFFLPICESQQLKQAGNQMRNICPTLFLSSDDALLS